VQGHDDIEKYQKLVEDVRLRRLAGLFFATSLTEYHGTPLLTAPGLPRFAIAAASQLPGVPKAEFDFPSFFKRAAERLAAQGARRPAVIAESSVAGGWLADPIMSTLRAFGMTTPEPWVQFVHMGSPGAIEQCVQLLFFKENGQHPDGLIIADDNLVEHATLALRSVMGPEADALPVVAHANFPSVATSHVRASRLGIDVRALFGIALDSIDAQVKGKPTTMFQLIPNVFEEEISR
jgi:DNA-binding LacI/PurR family transcriptional regulator